MIGKIVMLKSDFWIFQMMRIICYRVRKEISNMQIIIIQILSLVKKELLAKKRKNKYYYKYNFYN